MPRGIWALGFVSLFMDISSEMVHSLLPVFMATVLGASMATIGLVEGIAEATASFTKLASGAASDYLRKRKLLLVIGYGLGALSKPIFPLASSIAWIFAARFIDRVGKGIRGAPRDALVADITPARLRGTAYGLRQSLDTVGAFLGPLLAIAFMILLSDDLTSVLWVAVVPGAISVAVLVLAVREPERASHAGTSFSLSLRAVGGLSRSYWMVVALGAAFTLARFSEAFLVLRAQDTGLSLAFVPIVMTVMSVFYAAGAYPAGTVSDRIGARTLLVLGMVMLILADLALAMASSIWQVLAGAALWGMHMALTQGLLAKLVADTAPGELRGTAFGIFHLVSGVALLAASVIAGLLWDAFGPSATFVAGACFAALAAVGVAMHRA